MEHENLNRNYTTLKAQEFQLQAQREEKTTTQVEQQILIDYLGSSILVIGLSRGASEAFGRAHC